MNVGTLVERNARLFGRQIAFVAEGPASRIRILPRVCLRLAMRSLNGASGLKAAWPS
jgi:hypothetical protein